MYRLGPNNFSLSFIKKSTLRGHTNSLQYMFILLERPQFVLLRVGAGVNFPTTDLASPTNTMITEIKKLKKKKTNLEFCHSKKNHISISL